MSAARRYRKKPVVIDALQWDGVNVDAAVEFLQDGHADLSHLPSDGVHVGGGVGFTPPLGTLDIPTLEGTVTAQPGDWIIRGVKGEFYPCKPDIFAATYEAAATGDTSGECKVLVGRFYRSMHTTWSEWPESTFEQACDRIEKRRVETTATEAADEIIEVVVRRRARVRTEVTVDREPDPKAAS